jgi:hypothetical protein
MTTVVTTPLSGQSQGSNYPEPQYITAFMPPAENVQTAGIERPLWGGGSSLSARYRLPGVALPLGRFGSTGSMISWVDSGSLSLAPQVSPLVFPLW